MFSIIVYIALTCQKLGKVLVPADYHLCIQLSILVKYFDIISILDRDLDMFNYLVPPTFATLRKNLLHSQIYATSLDAPPTPTPLSRNWGEFYNFLNQWRTENCRCPEANNLSHHLFQNNFENGKNVAKDVTTIFSRKL